MYMRIMSIIYMFTMWGPAPLLPLTNNHYMVANLMSHSLLWRPSTGATMSMSSYSLYCYSCMLYYIVCTVLGIKLLLLLYVSHNENNHNEQCPIVEFSSLFPFTPSLQTQKKCFRCLDLCLGFDSPKSIRKGHMFNNMEMAFAFRKQQNRSGTKKIKS